MSQIEPAAENAHGIMFVHKSVKPSTWISTTRKTWTPEHINVNCPQRKPRNNRKKYTTWNE